MLRFEFGPQGVKSHVVRRLASPLIYGVGPFGPNVVNDIGECGPRSAYELCFCDWAD